MPTPLPAPASALLVHSLRHCDPCAEVFLGSNTELEAGFGVPGPFWGRLYLFWHKGAPICAIYEVFSRKLEEFMGPAVPPTPAAADDDVAATGETVVGVVGVENGPK